MRLTKKGIDNNYVVDTYISLNEPWKSSINKLGQLEDWEEKIEMPLIKFLEWRIESKLPYCIIEGKIKKVAHYHCLIERNIIEVWDANLKKRYRFYLKDYGKTWALTKEELL